MGTKTDPKALAQALARANEILAPRLEWNGPLSVEEEEDVEFESDQGEIEGLVDRFRRARRGGKGATRHHEGPGSAKWNLTKRELQIVHGIALGLSNKQIGRKLWISEHTVKTHVRRIGQKMSMGDRAGIVGLCFRHKVLRWQGAELIYSGASTAGRPKVPGPRVPRAPRQRRPRVVQPSIPAPPPHPPMPRSEFGTCPYVESWRHFCDKPYDHEDGHHCPCGVDF